MIIAARRMSKALSFAVELFYQTLAPGGRSARLCTFIFDNKRIATF